MLLALPRASYRVLQQQRSRPGVMFVVRSRVLFLALALAVLRRLVVVRVARRRRTLFNNIGQISLPPCINKHAIGGWRDAQVALWVPVVSRGLLLGVGNRTPITTRSILWRGGSFLRRCRC